MREWLLAAAGLLRIASAAWESEDDMTLRHPGASGLPR